MLRVIGIDFGTSTTYMNVKRYNGSEPDGDQFSYMPVLFKHGASGCVSTIIRENADIVHTFGADTSAYKMETMLFYISGIFSLVLSWHAQDYSHSIDDMSKLLMDLLSTAAVKHPRQE